MIFLSLFDGMGCGRITLKKMGIEPTKYYASEIDKFAIAENKANFPNTIHLGDVTNWREWGIDWSSIDWLIGGSPCQGFSSAGKQGGTTAIVNGEKVVVTDRETYLDLKVRSATEDIKFLSHSYLFWEYVLCLDHVKANNPNVKFMLENVKMSAKNLDMITEALGVPPVFINSALVCAQNRQRYYWCNFEVTQPEDRGILLKDIIEQTPTNPTVMTDRFVNRQAGRKCLVDNFDVKASNLSAMEYVKNGRQGDYVNCDGTKDARYRKLTVVECCRLQGVFDDYFKVSSNTQAYKMLGNGWQCDTIEHIFKCGGIGAA